jgi:hypothetical protein
MAPVKGPSVLHAFAPHNVSQHVMVMMMVRFHPVIHVVMHAFVHHRSVLSDGGCRDCDGGQRRQNVRNLLHLNSPWGELAMMERSGDHSVPLTLKEIYEPLFSQVFFPRQAAADVEALA